MAPFQQAGNVSLQPTTLAFDSSAELLWLGTDQGYVSSFNGSELRRYSSYRGHASIVPIEKPVRQILLNDRGVITLASKSMHLSLRGGPAQWNLMDERFQSLSCMAFTSRGTSEVLVGGGQSVMFTVNLERGTIASETTTDDDVKIMRRSSRNIICGSSKGQIRLLDTNSFQVVKQFESAHNGTILDMDTRDNLLITCGYNLRHGNYIVDPLVKLYDLRMQKALPPISFPGASFIRMHPKMTAVALIGTNSGQFQAVDVTSPITTKIYNANVSTFVSAMELAPSGDVLAMLDAEGVLQLWSTLGNTKFTEFAAPIEWPEPPVRPNVTIIDNTPLNMIGMPYFNEPLLSNWDPNMIFEVPKQPQQRIDPETIAAASVSGYAPFHRRHPRNYVERSRGTDNTGIVPAPKFLSQQARDRNPKNLADSAESKLLFGDDSKRQFEVPPLFKKLEIKYSKFGVEDFDFAFYNETKYSGLETNIPNSYMNPLLQLYRFTPRLRNVALFHTATYCTMEECLLCQMGFLFDMLEKANGQNCQATNLLKTLSSLPNAARHGVLEEDPASPGSLTMMMQSLNRFLLDQTIYDQKNVWQQNSAESELPLVLMIKATKRQQCMVCHKETRPMGDTVTTDLIYSPKPPGVKPLPTFSQMVRQSVQLETTQKGWCDKCRRYQTQHTRKSITKLPDVLTFNVTTQDKNLTHAKDYWSTPEWLPHEIGLTLNNKLLHVWQGEDLKRVEKRSNDQADLKIYELIGFVAEVREEEERRKHMISFINVALSSMDRQEGESNWHVFNDFLVQPIKKEEALDFTPKWKMPSVLCFQLKSSRCLIDNSWKNSIDTWLLYSDFPYLGHPRRENGTVLLQKVEAPQKGTLVALDAEFVSLQKEENEVKADGNKVIVRPSRLGLARVSVLRGQGELEGVPFIDDYIATKEPVVDFLTEYSGIHPGDLDPVISKRALVSLKVAYKRMWILLNLGCRFVGHGLLKDFRIINIHVPKDQVIDTVDLYALRSSQRKLSLRFLAWVVLSDHIQTDSHDSVEDSQTALRLYRKYLEYEDAGVLNTVFNRIESEGIKNNYRPPQPQDNNNQGGGSSASLLHLREDMNPMLRSEATSPQPIINVDES